MNSTRRGFSPGCRSTYSRMIQLPTARWRISSTHAPRSMSAVAWLIGFHLRSLSSVVGARTPSSRIVTSTTQSMNASAWSTLGNPQSQIGGKIRSASGPATPAIVSCSSSSGIPRSSRWYLNVCE
jgi:hypothetical protein